MLNLGPYDKSVGHIKINSWEKWVSKWKKTMLVDMVKNGWKPTPKKVPRGKSTPTNHTDSVTLAPNHVERG